MAAKGSKKGRSKRTTTHSAEKGKRSERPKRKEPEGNINVETIKSGGKMKVSIAKGKLGLPSDSEEEGSDTNRPDGFQLSV